MHVTMDPGVLAQAYLDFLDQEPDGREAVPGTDTDLVDFSREALERFKESAIRPLKKSAMSLEVIESRIAAVRAEISSIWSSHLPDDEKMRQISARETEISLLQAGQFAFARAGFSCAC